MSTRSRRSITKASEEEKADDEPQQTSTRRSSGKATPKSPAKKEEEKKKSPVKKSKEEEEKKKSPEKSTKEEEKKGEKAKTVSPKAKNKPSPLSKKTPSPEKKADPPAKKRGRRPNKANEQEEERIVKKEEPMEEEEEEEEEEERKPMVKKEEADDEEGVRVHEVISVSLASDDSDTDPKSPPTVTLTAAGLLLDIELGMGTDDKCGQCMGCNSPPCNECSACKRGNVGECIDAYCSNMERGREQRVAARDLYIKSIASKVRNDSFDEDTPTIVMRKEVPGRKTISPIAENQENYPGLKRGPANYVYGARSSAAKTRRCGECEGCMRDDCGTCPACLDKPRFGGKGTKKRACVERACRIKGSKSFAMPASGTKRSMSEEFVDELEADLDGPPPAKRIHL